MQKNRSLVSAALLVSLSLSTFGHFAVQSAMAKPGAGWIDSDQEEFKMPAGQQPQQAPDQGRSAANANTSGDDDAMPATSKDRGFQRAGDDDDDSAPKKPARSGWSGAGGGVTSGENASQSQGMVPEAPEVDENGHPTNLDELDKRPIQTPKLTVSPGGGAVLSGGVTSANFRANNILNRGTDHKAAEILRAEPRQAVPRTLAIQHSDFKAFLDAYQTGAVANCAKGDLIEIKGQWDDCGHALRNFGFPFQRISPNAITTTDLSKTKVIIVNCGAEFDDNALQKIRDYVSSGGFLMTTDWALDSCLQKAFPGYVSWNGGYTDNSVVDAACVYQDPELTKGIPTYGYWKLEDKSQTVQVLKPLEVAILVRSRILAGYDPGQGNNFDPSTAVQNGIPTQRDTRQLGILALTFPYGDGQILHLVGHFDNNADRAFTNALPDPCPDIKIAMRQAIAANFIITAVRSGGPVGH